MGSNFSYEVGDKILYDDFVCFIYEVSKTHYSIMHNDGEHIDHIHIGDCWLFELIEKNSKGFPKIRTYETKEVYVLKHSEEDEKPEMIEIDGIVYKRLAQKEREA